MLLRAREAADSHDCLQANGSQVYYNITVDASQQRQPPDQLSPAMHTQESSSDDITLDMSATSVSEQERLKEVCPVSPLHLARPCSPLTCCREPVQGGKRLHPCTGTGMS